MAAADAPEQGRAPESAAAAAAAAPAPSADAEQSRAAAPAAAKTEDAKGVILFSNSRSGGGKGKQVLDALSDIIGKDRVFDLGENPHPEQILAQPHIVEEARNGLRVIVCGGDGTMTWLMAAIDVVKNEVEGAKHCHYLIAPMPLGTGNDLARSLNWGGHFSRKCTSEKWVAQVKNAEPKLLDRWACSVMPNAEGQRNKTVLHVPEVFSVHEYSAHVDEAETHTVVRKGRHHSARMTARVQDQLKDHASQASTLASVDEVEDSFDATVKETNLPISERRPSISQHVKPSETVLKLGGTWRSYDGTFSNYFSIGLDAAGAFAFHAERRKNPARFSSRAKNQLLYAWLGMKATGGCCGCQGPPPKLIDVTTVLCKVEDTWEEVTLPKSCRGLIVLNLQSYAGGRNLWGRDKETTSDDGVLEIVTVDDVFSLGWKLVTTKGLGGSCRRLIRCKELRVRATEKLHMQIDGEPWAQPPATVHIKAIGRSQVLAKR
ncbi:unnamed protein product [Pelagomonas calceolata]|uniref:Diacylglycerol kinase n=1 Tax=Pelagomonas calceolata TaxID=35677 RepID=A0A7S3ZLY9_9STRA|nr:unnamed protein product [Pelagomonas calceolata]